MKKLLQFFAPYLFIIAFLIFPDSAFAQGNLCPPGFESLCRIKPDNAGSVVGGIWSLIFVIAVLTALVFIAWGGVKWITSTGDQQKVASARSTIIAAVVGLLIALLTFFIVNVITIFFTGGNISGISIPKLVQ